MKIFGFSTILLGFVLVNLMISFGLIASAMYKMSVAPEYEIDCSNVVTKRGLPAKTFWTDNKILFIVPSVSNILSMILLAVLLVMN